MARILLIDDDDAFRRMLRLTLERRGHSVFDVPNGTHAVQLLGTHAVDLVLTDIIMPEKDGLETLMELRKLSGVAVIAMSGGGRMSAHSYLTLASKLGAVAVLAKPFSTDEMDAAIARALPPPSPPA